MRRSHLPQGLQDMRRKKISCIFNCGKLGLQKSCLLPKHLPLLIKWIATLRLAMLTTAALTWPFSEGGRMPEACGCSSALHHLCKGPREITSDNHKEWRGGSADPKEWIYRRAESSSGLLSIKPLRVQNRLGGKEGGGREQEADGRKLIVVL